MVKRKEQAEAAAIPAAMTTTRLHLDGVSCADCAQKLEARVAKLPGVARAEINFTAARLLVDHTVPLADILRTITESGYTATVEAPRGERTTHFRVRGLDCPDCAAGLAERLRRTEGISAAELNYAAATLVATHSLPVEAVQQLIHAAGYEATPADGPATPPSGGFLHTHRRAVSTTASGVLLVIAFILSKLDMASWVSITLYLGASVAGGWWTAQRAWASAKARMADMNVLMMVAVIGAACIGQWSEGASVAFLYSVSNMLESYSMEKTRQSIRALMNVAPREASVRRDGREQRVPVDDVQVDETVLVHPGEKIAVDGIVLAGESAVNQAAVTGESVPVSKMPGDEVYAGTLNELGALEVRVTRIAEDSTLARIVHLVEEAQARRSPTQAFVDRFAGYYTPVVLLLAAGLAVVPPLIIGAGNLAVWGHWIYTALALVVLACPCALVISTPVAIVTAIGNAARHGALIKGGTYLEQAGQLSVIAFDKTGTLTQGRPVVTDIITLNGHSERELLALAAAVESRSPHPLAQAVLQRSHELGVAVPVAERATSLPGRGAQAMVEGRQAYVGNLRLFTELGIDMAPAAARMVALEDAGKTAMLVSVGDHLAGIIAAADEVRVESAPTIRALHRAGVRRVVMLTGDGDHTARRIAEQLGMDEYRAGLLPEDKVTAIEQLRAAYGAVGMVGDGINDAPALATANVGIAMGGAGTDTALETADIALMADDLCKLPYTIRISRKALGIIRQNIALALGIKLIALSLAPFGLLTLWLAVVADMGASLLVTVNGLRLLAERPGNGEDSSCG